ncbi:hypothetical protein EDB86DRAFT_2953973 [Lactarius hatsudake]|nr:hypothetical protein EDB86DRAFT_2953973 [Lactarius hatsudake]
MFARAVMWVCGFIIGEKLGKDDGGAVEKIDSHRAALNAVVGPTQTFHASVDVLWVRGWNEHGPSTDLVRCYVGNPRLTIEQDVEMN